MKQEPTPGVKQFFACHFLEHKTEGETGVFSGYGATYNLDLVGDRIVPGAFAESIVAQKGKIPILNAHEWGEWIGHTRSLAEDERGLLTHGKFFMNTDDGRNAYGLLKDAAAEDIRVGMSIGFIAKTWDWDKDVRLLTGIDVREISLTAFPANPRAHITDLKSIRDVEDYMREQGLSRSAARDVLASIKRISGGMPEPINFSNVAAALKDAGLGDIP